MAGARRGFFAPMNWLFFRLFLTLWAIAYYFSFFQNPVYLTLIAAAIGGDFVRWRGMSFNPTSNNIVIGVIAILYALHVWLVMQSGIVEVAFYVPWNHFVIGQQYADAPFASWVYLVETAGIALGLCFIVVFALRPRGTPLSLNVPPQLEIRKLFFFFVILYAVTLLTIYFGVGAAATVAHSFRPESNFIHLIAYATMPSFFAFGMKYWLAEVRLLKS
jgi:hypothetical protein